MKKHADFEDHENIVLDLSPVSQVLGPTTLTTKFTSVIYSVLNE